MAQVAPTIRLHGYNKVIMRARDRLPDPTDKAGEGLCGAPTGNGGTLEQTRVYRVLRTLCSAGHVMLRATDEAQLLRDMCQVIAQQRGYPLVAVGYAQHDPGQTIHWIESVGIDLALLESLHLSWADSASGQTSSGTAIRTGKPSVAREIFSDPAYAGPSFAALRADGIKHGFAAASSFPLIADGVVFGTLSLAAAEPEAFDDQEVDLLSELAADLSFGIANLQLRQRHTEAQGTIARLAYYDPLTGLPNRTFLLEQVEQAIDAAALHKRNVALLHLRVGRFDELNDVLGHSSGDQMLKELARRIALTVARGATLARVGDAELALLLPTGDVDAAVSTAQFLSELVHDPVPVADLMVDASVRVGIALYPSHALSAESLLRRASAARRHARPMQGGHAIYAGGQEELNCRRLELMSDFRRAIEHGELSLCCQPKVDIASRRVCGAEALVRWMRPVQGLVPTAEFIGMAEQAGLITQLTNWVLDHAFRQIHDWRQAGFELPLSINLSAHDLHDTDLVCRVRTLLAKWNVEPRLVQFELTESAVMEDAAGALVTLRALKEGGTTLFIDDFGTGYSSLSYLQKLPVDGVKIDQSFIIPMAEDSDSDVIVRSTIELVHNLDMAVVAEGVESQQVWDLLASVGCDVAQGYLVSAPMAMRRLPRWHAAWSRAKGGRA
jgi:diguanylate cyclase (GGDEF)-like protein